MVFVVLEIKPIRDKFNKYLEQIASDKTEKVELKYKSINLQKQRSQKE